ncbi:GAF domain-containing protein [Actinoplanes sp. NPDC049596]|uniref:GAF domain-containing protein n=1 Tax=unclassified Actinoplanes TaxID=2626549 RepID=UPI00341A9B50
MQPTPSLADRHRLEVLASIDFDDPRLRQELDRLTERTAHRLGAPVSLVTLLSHISQFFAGSSGLPAWISEVQGTPAEWSFCTDVVTTGEAHTYQDLAAHPVHETNPLVVVDGARSYAGVPLVVDGEVVGAHCVVGLAERAYTEEEIEQLRSGAQDVVAILQRYRRRETG